MLSLSITRTALSLSPLVITDNPNGTTLHVPEDGVEAVGWDYRRSYAPDSDWRSGKALLAAVREASTLPLSIYAHADTSAALATVKADLEAAVTQWSYTVTLSVDGVVQTFQAEPAIPQWGAVDSGMVRAHLDRCRLVIPVNP